MFERNFTLEDQDIFARLSGDHNPLHLDEITARRNLFGGVVVHGVHTVLWALDKWAERTQGAVELVSLKAIFKKGVRVGKIVKCKITKEEEGHLKLEIYDEEMTYTSIEAGWKSLDAEHQRRHDLNPDFPQSRDCKVLSPEELMNASGELGLCIEQDTVSRLFPNLTRCLAFIQVAEILATVRLVGMECPGLHSIFYELDVIFDNPQGHTDVLKYKVVNFDSRLSLLVMEVQAPFMKGTVKAFLRPPLTEQDSYADLCKIVSPGEFKGQNAFIVGGSRGAGEVTAKLLAAGGAEVVLTYFKGEQDAQKVAAEIIAGGGHAQAIRFDVLAPAESQLGELAKFVPTHLYYFATPHITGQKGVFSARLFKEFCDYYVIGFSNTFSFFSGHLHLPVKVFYPSSVFVEEPPSSLGEYAVAKAAGESLCLFIEKNRRGTLIYRPRLPKIATDQTASIMFNDCRDPGPVMLEHLKDFRDGKKSC